MNSQNRIGVSKEEFNERFEGGSAMSPFGGGSGHVAIVDAPDIMIRTWGGGGGGEPPEGVIYEAGFEAGGLNKSHPTIER